MFDWNDIRIFVAVTREGSTLAAARTLRMNQTTVARRVASLEQKLELVLFEKLQSGYRLTPAGERILPWAERLQAEAETIDTIAHQERTSFAGVIRVTVNESIANRFLTPALGDFGEAYPDVRVQLIIDDRRLDLSRGEADVAIRAGSRPEGGQLVIRKLATAMWSFYCSQSYKARRGCPSSGEELKDHVLLAGNGGLAGAPAMKWMMEVAPDALVHSYSNSVTNHLVAVRAGLGVGPLPCIEGDSYSDLVRCFAPPRQFDSEVLLITRSDLKDVPRIRAFNDFIVTRFAAMRHFVEAAGAGRPQKAI